MKTQTEYLKGIFYGIFMKFNFQSNKKISKIGLLFRNFHNQSSLTVGLQKMCLFVQNLQIFTPRAISAFRKNIRLAFSISI